MFKLTPPAKRALAAYTAADDATRAKLGQPFLRGDGKPMQAFEKPGFKAALSDALVAWKAWCEAARVHAGDAYTDLRLYALRATLGQPRMTHRQARVFRADGVLTPIAAAADLELQGVLVALICLAPAESSTTAQLAAYAKLTQAWRKAGLPL